MKTFAILSGLVALVAAAPYPIGTGFAAPSGTGFPAPTGSFPHPNGIHGHHDHHPPGYAHPTGTAPLVLPTGTAPPHKREAQVLGSLTLPSLSLPTLSLPSISLPTGLGSGSAAATGLSGFELARRRAQFGGSPSFSFSLPTLSMGAGPTGFDMPSFSMPTGQVEPTGGFSGAPLGVAEPTGRF